MSHIILAYKINDLYFRNAIPVDLEDKFSSNKQKYNGLNLVNAIKEIVNNSKDSKIVLDGEISDEDLASIDSHLKNIVGQYNRGEIRDYQTIERLDLFKDKLDSDYEAKYRKQERPEQTPQLVS